MCNHIPRGYEFSRYLAGFPRQLRYIGILAVQAAEVAAYSGYGIGKAARQKMKKWFLLNGIDISGHQASIYQSHELIILVFPYPAYSSLSRPDTALLMAKVALHIAVELFPELGLSNLL